MKKALFLILTICSLLSSFLWGGAFALAEGKTESPYEIAYSYATEYADRSVGGAEQKAAQSLAAGLSKHGYVVQEYPTDYYKEDASGVKIHYHYSHVVGFLNNEKSKTVMIGCYYGGYEVNTLSSSAASQGASTALSVGTVLYVAEALSKLSCDCNIKIALWGGIGTDDELRLKDCGITPDTVDLYINLDCVAAGDYDYLYADDVPRAQEDFFQTVIAEKNVSVRSAPAYKRTTSLATGNGGAYDSYTHLGILGANRYFLNSEIPTVSFVGGNWTYDCGLYRYSEKGDIEGTSLDTFKEINGRNGGEEVTARRVQGVADVIVAGVTDERLIGVLGEAAKETTGADLHSKLAYYLITFIGLGAVILVFILLFVLQGKERREEIWDSAFDSKDAPQDPFEEINSGRDPFVDPYDHHHDRHRSKDDDDDVFRL